MGPAICSGDMCRVGGEKVLENDGVIDAPYCIGIIFDGIGKAFIGALRLAFIRVPDIFLLAYHFKYFPLSTERPLNHLNLSCKLIRCSFGN